MDAKETLERLADWWELPGGDEESQRLRAAAIRGVLEENERLKADADRVAAACNVEMADLRTRWNAAEARIDAALALHYEVDEFGEKLCKWCGVALPCPTVKALKGERG